MYREKYFKPGRSNGYIVYDYIPVNGAEEKIYESISDICISMKKEDYLDMPTRKYIKVPFMIIYQPYHIFTINDVDVCICI